MAGRAELNEAVHVNVVNSREPHRGQRLPGTHLPEMLDPFSLYSFYLFRRVHKY